MAGGQFRVDYPRPSNIKVHEQMYQNEQEPMAVQNFVGKTKPVATRVL